MFKCSLEIRVLMNFVRKSDSVILNKKVAPDFSRRALFLGSLEDLFQRSLDFSEFPSNDSFQKFEVFQDHFESQGQQSNAVTSQQNNENSIYVI